MLVFHGGLTSEQVEKLKSDVPIIYDKIPYKKASAKRNNTFDYVPKELYSAPLHIFRKYISEDCYAKQYVFLARYLSATFDFCNNSQKKNYIMVCDIDETILKNYIGVGDYCDGDYRIEYRLPRKFITLETIKEFLFFEPYDEEQMLEFKRKYKDNYDAECFETETAKRLILEKGLEFNGKRNWQ